MKIKLTNFYSLCYKSFVHHYLSVVAMKIQKEAPGRQIQSLSEQSRTEQLHSYMSNALLGSTDPNMTHTNRYLDKQMNREMKTGNAHICSRNMSLKTFRSTILPFTLIKSETVDPAFEFYIGISLM